MEYYSLPFKSDEFIRRKANRNSSLRDSVIQHIRLMLDSRQLQFRAYPLFGSVIRNIEYSLPFNPEEDSPYVLIDSQGDRGKVEKAEKWFEETFKPALTRTLKYSLSNETRFIEKPKISVQLLNQVEQAEVKKILKKLRPDLLPAIEKRHSQSLVFVIFEGGKLIDGSSFFHEEPIPLFY
jgi:hypothetical protein